MSTPENRRAVAMRNLGEALAYQVTPIYKRLARKDHVTSLSNEAIAWCESRHWRDDWDKRHGVPDALAPSITTPSAVWTLHEDAVLPLVFTKVWDIPETHPIHDPQWTFGATAGVDDLCSLSTLPPDWGTWAAHLILNRDVTDVTAHWIARSRKELTRLLTPAPIQERLTGQSRTFRLYLDTLVAKAATTDVVYQHQDPPIKFNTIYTGRFEFEGPVPDDLQAVLRVKEETLLTLLRWKVVHEEWRLLFRLAPSVKAIKLIWPQAGLLAQLILRTTNNFAGYRDGDRLHTQFAKLRDYTPTARQQKSVVKNAKIRKLATLLTPEQWAQRQAMWNTLVVSELMQSSEGATK